MMEKVVKYFGYLLEMDELTITVPKFWMQPS